MTQFRFVVPAYRAAPWIGRCLGSIRRQRRKDFRCVVLDDRSDDGTFERAQEAVAGDPRFEVTQSPVRRLAMENLVHGIRQSGSDPDDVIVVVDGDDWLPHARVLDVLAREYASPETWLTYGSHRRWNGGWRDRLGLRAKRGIAKPYPAEVARDRLYRGWPVLVSHLRTFRRFLWERVRDEDLRGEDGAYYRTCYDLAMMFPMLEMAGPAHVRYLHDILYVYNNANPISDHRAAVLDQTTTACRIRLSRPYAPLERRPGV